MSIDADGSVTGTAGAGVLTEQAADDVLAIVKGTCQRLYASEPAFVDALAQALPPLVPTLTPVPGDVRRVAESLARAVLWAVLTTDSADVVEATLVGVGAEGVHHGLTPDTYHGVGHALLRAVRETYAGDWSSELSSAWVAWYAWAGAHLAAGARGPLVQVTPVSPAPVAAPPAPPAPAPAPQAPSAPAGTPQPRTPVHRHVRAAPATERRDPHPLADPSRPHRPAGVPASLDEVLHLLRVRYFADDERALAAIVTRVALRTGADLQAPRADQRMNPAVVANVLAVLNVMGYLDDRPADGAPGAPTSGVPWTGGRRGGWRRAVPGLFR